MPDSRVVIAHLNDRAQPLDRGELYEDPLDHVLTQANVGAVTCGGTQLADDGEVAFCEVEIELEDVSTRSLEIVTALLERLGAPKGSRLIVEAGGHEIPFGTLEGLAVYLNGTDLPDEVYSTSDVNHVYDEFNRLLDGLGGFYEIEQAAWSPLLPSSCPRRDWRFDWRDDVRSLILARSRGPIERSRTPGWSPRLPLPSVGTPCRRFSMLLGDKPDQALSREETYAASSTARARASARLRRARVVRSA